MKKLVIFISFAFISFAAFSEQLKMLPWTTTKNEIMDKLINDGWDCSLDKDNNNAYNFKPKTIDVTYNGEKVTLLTLLFDSNNKLVIQNFTLDNNFELDTGLLAILSQAVVDKAQFIDTVYKSENSATSVSYIANIDDYTALYMVYASKNKVLVGITYTTVK